MSKPDPREFLRIWEASHEQREDMRQRDLEAAQQEAADLETQLAQVVLGSPESQKLLKKLTAAMTRVQAAQKMKTWLRSKGIR